MALLVILVVWQKVGRYAPGAAIDWCISNPAAADAGRPYLPGGRELPHPPASHPGRPLGLYIYVVAP